MLLFASLAAAGFSQTSVGTAFIIPWIDSSSSACVYAFNFEDSKAGLSLDAVFLDIPALSSDAGSAVAVPSGILSLTDFCLPAMRASFSRTLGPVSVMAGIGSFSIPARKTVIEKQTLLVRPETGWIFDAGAGFRSLSVHSVYAFDSALCFAGGTEVGSADASFGGLALSWKGLSAFWFRCETDASVSAHLRLNPSYGFSFEGSAKGSISAYGGSVAFDFSAAGGCLSFFACAGLLGSDAIQTSYYYDYNEDIDQGSPSFGYNRDPFVVFRASYERHFAGVWSFQASRLVAWVREPRISSMASGGGGEKPDEPRVSADFGGKIAAFDPVTLLFAGFGVSVRLYLQ